MILLSDCGSLLFVILTIIVVVNHNLTWVAVEAVDTEAVPGPVQWFGEGGDGVVLSDDLDVAHDGTGFNKTVPGCWCM